MLANKQKLEKSSDSLAVSNLTLIIVYLKWSEGSAYFSIIQLSKLLANISIVFFAILTNKQNINISGFIRTIFLNN